VPVVLVVAAVVGKEGMVLTLLDLELLQLAVVVVVTTSVLLLERLVLMAVLAVVAVLLISQCNEVALVFLDKVTTVVKVRLADLLMLLVAVVEQVPLGKKVIKVMVVVA
jgi:hypothetical protein